MAEPVLKSDPVLKLAPDAAKADEASQPPAPRRGALYRYRRLLLLVVVPAIAAIGGVALYLHGGRYVTTDNAFVGAQKILITPDVAGRVQRIVVVEGQHVKVGDVLFEIDPEPLRLAFEQARAQADLAKVTFNTLVNNLKIYAQMQELSKQGIELKLRDVERKSALVKNNFGSQLDLDNAIATLVTTRSQFEYLNQQISNARNQLLGDTDLPLEKFPPYANAKAAADQAERNLKHTVLRAPMNGVATQVDNIQLGRYLSAGTPILSILDIANPWIDANLKESDFTHIEIGAPVDITVDAFPGHTFKGKIASLSPGTGAQFAILPPQNAMGNFVKVVQRVPIRIRLDTTDDAVQKLKSGMSSYVTIDTGHTRTLAGLFGLNSAAAEKN